MCIVLEVLIEIVSTYDAFRDETKNNLTRVTMGAQICLREFAERQQELSDMYTLGDDGIERSRISYCAGMPLDIDRWPFVVEMLQAVLIVVVAFQVRSLTENATAIQFHVQLMGRSQVLDEFFKGEQTTARITFPTAESLCDERHEVHALSYMRHSITFSV